MAYIEPTASNLARIKVIGIGGGGQNSVSSMVNSNRADGVEFIAMNTDLQALNSSLAQVRLQLGPQKTKGLGSGSDPEVGSESAQESLEEIKSHLQGADMVFIAAGFGGGTGTGAAPIIAEMAKEMGALTVGVVTKPFAFEGKRRMHQAEQGIRDLRGRVDALIVIPNEKLLEVVDKELPLTDAFKVADRVVGQAVEGISDLITSTGLVNVDFADVRTVMQNAGSALMGIGEADGENRAENAAKMAINSPLLSVDIKGSTGVLINIVGSNDLSMHEVNEAAKVVADAAHEAANIIFGANIDPEVEGVRVTVVATGFESDFETLGLPDYPIIKDEEVISQIDSRFDAGSDNGDDDLDEEPEGDVGEEVEFDDNGDFDVEKLREEIARMGDKEDEKIDGDVEDETPQEEKRDQDSKSSGLWKFIKRSTSD